MKCSAEATPPATIKWYYDGSPIQNDENFAITSDNTTLTVKDMKVSGKFQCEINNGVEKKVFDAAITISGLGEK